MPQSVPARKVKGLFDTSGSRPSHETTSHVTDSLIRPHGEPRVKSRKKPGSIRSMVSPYAPLLFVVAVLVSGFAFYQLVLVYRPDGSWDDCISTAHTKRQSTSPDEPTQRFFHRPIHSFDIQGLVLSSKAYGGGGNEAILSPIDLALGWGPMSSRELVAQLDISQRLRRYYWYCHSFSDLGIEAEDISRNSSNIHIVPANDEVAEKVSRLNAATAYLSAAT